MNYDFQILSPFEFEILSRDIIQKELNLRLESFGEGRDSGIDLRYSKGDQGIIVQCKRYKDFKSLYPNLKKETLKVKDLNPTRYLISTSSSLLPHQKDKILKLFKPYIKSTSDIFSKEDLNNFLSLFPVIEKKHYKLWLNSIPILESIFNSQVVNQTKIYKSEIQNKIRVYVEDQNFTIAKDLLNKSKYVILSGNPGTGKTTLAEMLVFNLLAKGIQQFIFISDSINQGYKLYNEAKSQVFLFDDFLGRNFLNNNLPTNEDRAIIRFIERIQNDNSKFLILTTREYILKSSN